MPDYPGTKPCRTHKDVFGRGIAPKEFRLRPILETGSGFPRALGFEGRMHRPEGPFGYLDIGEEVVGEFIVLAKRVGDRLFRMHCKENHASTDDDVIVGTAHSICYLEILYWLERCGYAGWLSRDQYPYRGDGPGALVRAYLAASV